MKREKIRFCNEQKVIIDNMKRGKETDRLLLALLN